jgi:hypothetical protein
MPMSVMMPVNMVLSNPVMMEVTVIERAGKTV